MKLYYTKGACSLASRIVINEIGLDAEFEEVNLKTKKTEGGEDFLKINPKGSVPVLELNTGEILTENAVIQQYLADMEGAAELLPPPREFKRYRVLEWLNYIATELHKGFGPLFNPNFPQEVKDKIVIPLIKTKLSFIDRHIKPGQFLMGPQFTLPDAYLAVILNWMVHFKIPVNEWKNLSQYATKLKNHPSVLKSFKQEGLKVEAV